MNPATRAKMTKLREKALTEVSKSEQLQFRIDAESVKKLYLLAAKQRLPVGTMVRQWVLDKLESEIQGKPSLEDRLEALSNEMSSLSQRDTALTKLFLAVIMEGLTPGRKGRGGLTRQMEVTGGSLPKYLNQSESLALLQNLPLDSSLKSKLLKTMSEYHRQSGKR